MKRHYFTAAIICALLFLACPVMAEEVIELKLAHFIPSTHIQHQKTYLPFAHNVEMLSGGKVKIKIYPGGTLGGPLQLPDAVKTGITDIAFVFPSMTTGRFPRFSAYDLPFLFNNSVQATHAAYELYERYLAEDFKDYKLLWLYCSDMGQLYSVDKPILTMEDFKGMKIRSPSASMSDALTRLGANPVGLPITELYMALAKHVIDGALTPNTVVADFKLYDQIRHITQADVYVSIMTVVMNKKKYDALPPFAKQAIDGAAGKQWGLHAAKVYDDYAKETVTKMRASGKVKIHDMSALEKKRMRDQLVEMENDWIRQNSARGIPAREMMDAVHRAAAKFE
jgi:TRAP-type C4-dicarboxylate transport system substrate-binding protein